MIPDFESRFSQKEKNTQKDFFVFRLLCSRGLIFLEDNKFFFLLLLTKFPSHKTRTKIFFFGELETWVDLLEKKKNVIYFPLKHFYVLR
jgi:hypothetical protein